MDLVGLVVVSHSRPLAEAAVALAMEMVHGDRPPVVVAAGMPDGGFGTDATAVMAAVEEASAGAGVVVLVDLGSAIMSAEMAVEFLEGEGIETRIVAAPFVEGLLAAVVVAAGGGSLADVAAEAAGALQPKLEALGEESGPQAASRAAVDGWQPEATAHAVLPNEAGLHARPAAELAAAAGRFDADVMVAKGGKTVSAASPIALATLAARLGDTLLITARGPQAAEAVEAVRALVDDGFGETAGVPDSAEPEEPAEPARPGVPRGVSPGRVTGTAYRMAEPLSAPPAGDPIPADGVAAEATRLDDALAATVEGYRQRALLAEGQAKQILEATAMLAADPALRDGARALIIERRLPAANALWEAAGEITRSLTKAGGRMAERATDVADIRDRTVARLLAVPMPGLPEPGHPYVLLARDLAPTDTATLLPETCLAIVTAEGGPTSHTSILARSMGIPAVVGAVASLDIPDGTPVVVDGDTGEVIANPSQGQLAGARTAPAPLEPLAGPGATADGTRLPLLANIGSVADARKAAAAGAEGIGLFRTEICFLDRAVEPSVAEQVETYRAVLDHFAGRCVVIRTLDAGSDKPMPFLGIGDEPNPALGIRGYRTAAADPGVLRRQLEAIVEATGDDDVWVMAPMISTPAEAAAFARLARAVGVRKVGVMVETPSAALQAAELFDHVEFVSVGTNDLTQYTMAADREGAGLGELQDPWQPGVLRLLERIGAAATAAGKSAGVCGEAASDPLLAPVLAGLGITSLSMGARQLHAVGQALGQVTLEQCRAAAKAASAAADPKTARAVARELLGGDTAEG